MAKESVVYALQSVSVASVARLPYQIMVIDRYNASGAEWTVTQIARMGGGLADPRQLFSYLSIGESEDYRPYWQPSWLLRPPMWLGPENPEWNGNYAVKFWHPAWIALVKEDLRGIIAQGFDGVFFDVVDVYERHWVSQQGRTSPALDMVNLVKVLSDYAKSINPSFRIYVNNAEKLLTNTTYLGAIDGVLKESLYYSGFGERRPEAEIQSSTKLLDIAKAKGKNVSVIEYVSEPNEVSDVRTRAVADGYGYYTSNRELTGINPGGFSTFTSDSIVVGTQANESIIGTKTKDIILGQGGNDQIRGKLGNDIVTGGAGKDAFVFDTKPNQKTNRDTIKDFAVKDDSLWLDDAIFKLPGVKGLAEMPVKIAKQFFSLNQARDRNDYIIFNTKSGILAYDVDGSGPKAAVDIAVLKKSLKVTYHDLYVI